MDSQSIYFLKLTRLSLYGICYLNSDRSKCICCGVSICNFDFNLLCSGWDTKLNTHNQNEVAVYQSVACKVIYKKVAIKIYIFLYKNLSSYTHFLYK